jgi:hypothetical protein
MPLQREPGAPIMKILFGNIEIYQSWYDYSKLRKEVEDDGPFVPFPPHIDPACCSDELEETIPRRDS